MAALIPQFAKNRIWPDRGADLRRDHWRSNGDRYPTGHGFHQHRQGPDSAIYGAPDLVSRRRTAAPSAHRRLVKTFAVALEVVVFTSAIGIALAGLFAAIVTPPI